MGGIGVPQNHWVQHFWKPLNMVGISNKINFNIFTVWMALKFFWCFLLQYQIIFDQTYTIIYPKISRILCSFSSRNHF